MMQLDYAAARVRWLRNLESQLVLPAVDIRSALARVDAWLPVVLPTVTREDYGQGGRVRVQRYLSFRSSPLRDDSRHVKIPEGVALADRADIGHVDGGWVHVLYGDSEVESAVSFNIFERPRDADETPDGVEVALHAWYPVGSPELVGSFQAVLDRCADVPDLVYGQVGYSQGTSPAMIRMHPKALGRQQAWRRGVLLGYDWITYVRADLTARISPERLAEAQRALFRVSWLEHGVLRLQATEFPEEYDERALRSMFLALVDVLPDGVPSPIPTGWPGRPFEAEMLWYEDPADYR